METLQTITKRKNNYDIKYRMDMNAGEENEKEDY
jgi:hypothetical protein